MGANATSNNTHAVEFLYFTTKYPHFFDCRCNRRFSFGDARRTLAAKVFDVVGDTVTVLTTIAFLLLYTSANLHIWQLYLIGAIAGAFQQVQELAYSASITLMVPQQQCIRASGLRALSGRFSQIIAPPLAGFLYYAIGVAGIAVIDIITFGVAIATVLFVTIPQPSHNLKSVSLTQLQELQFGIRYILNDRSLLALLMINLLFWLPHDIGDSLLFTANSFADAK